MAILSEILRFVLPPNRAKAAEFLKLRQQLAASPGIREQYFGYIIPVKGSGLTVREHEMCWVIETSKTQHRNRNFRRQLDELIADTTQGENEARSLVFPFEDTQMSELTKALEAPICEFAFINLLSAQPKSEIAFTESMHKTFTDCYYAPGFTGGAWAYASNTNDTDGTVIGGGKGSAKQQGSHSDDADVPEPERKLACYYLGWESVEHHHAYSSTELFAEEIDKLAPHFGQGTGAWYVNFEKHV